MDSDWFCVPDRIQKSRCLLCVDLCFLRKRVFNICIRRRKYGVWRHMGAYGCIWMYTDAHECIRMHIGCKSLHLVAHSPNLSNELRHVFLKSDRSCQNWQYLSILGIYIQIYVYIYVHTHIYIYIYTYIGQAMVGLRRTPIINRR